jgi:competence protein ComEC
MPLVAYHFQQVNPYSVPVGLLLSPVVFVCLMAGVAKIALTAAVPGLAGAWSAGAAIPAELLRHAVHIAAKLPGSDLPIRTPGWGWLVVWYAGLLAFALPNRAGTAGRSGQRKWLSTAVRVGSPATGALLLAAPLAGMNPVHPDNRPMKITLLAVGAGQCAVIEAPDGKATLIDTGSTSTSQMMRQVLEPFLRYEGRRHVARVVLTGSGLDRTSAAGDVVADCGDPAVFTSAGIGRSVGENWQYAELLDHLDRSGHSATPIHAGESIDLGQGISLTALWPPPLCGLAGVNAGLVLKLRYAGRTMLFPGDTSEPAEQALLQTPAALAADMLVAPHQGTCDAETAGLIRAVDPIIVASSDSGELTAKQQRLAPVVGNRPLLRTGECGAITITIAADGSVSIVPFLGSADGGGRESFSIAAGQRRVNTDRGSADH